jgi:hypothetical protein
MYIKEYENASKNYSLIFKNTVFRYYDNISLKAFYYILKYIFCEMLTILFNQQYSQKVIVKQKFTAIK